MRTQLAPASARTRIKKFLRASLSIAFVLLIASTFDGWLRYAGYTFGALVAVVLVVDAWRGQVAPCPSCHAPLGANSDGDPALTKNAEPLTLRCERCGEYLSLLRGEVRLHEPVVADTPTFKSRAFENGVWPDGCVLCGDRVTRRESLGRSSLGDVPYCGAHDRAVTLSSDDDELVLEWRSLPMLRKYLAANRRTA